MSSLRIDPQNQYQFGTRIAVDVIAWLFIFDASLGYFQAFTKPFSTQNSTASTRFLDVLPLLFFGLILLFILVDIVVWSKRLKEYLEVKKREHFSKKLIPHLVVFIFLVLINLLVVVGIFSGGFDRRDSTLNESGSSKLVK